MSKFCILKCVVLCLLALMCTGCFDVFTYVTVDENDNIVTTFKMTVNKQLLEMAGEDIDYDMFPDEEYVSEDFGDKAEYSVIDTKTEYGVVVELVTNREEFLELQEDADSVLQFVPMKTDNGYVLSFSGDSEDDLDDEMSLMVLGSLKYQLFMSKNFISSITDVYSTDEYGNTTKVVYFEFEDAYLVEIPLLLLMSGEEITIEE